MVAVEKIVKRFFRKDFLVNTFIKNTLIVMIKEIEEAQLIDVIGQIKKTFQEFYKKEFSVALSQADLFDNLHILFQEAKEILKYKFYIGEGSLIRKEDVKEGNNYKILKDYNFVIEQIAITVKCGDIKAVNSEIEDFIKDLKDEKLDKDIIISYSMELLLSIVRNNFESIRENFDKSINDYFGRIINIQKLKNINEIEENIKKIALEIAEANYNTFKHKKNRLIELVLQKVDENIDNENLSLKWLSSNIVFANVDYLSKLFKKETGKNFSHFVMEQRMEKAKKMLENTALDKIYEVALKVGFGYNSQYFSQVFKNYTGLSPTDYRKKLVDENIIE
jgi:two-component system, response regulator YesN